MSKQQLKQAGFTIIEVVLVLAIAALIFLMVFIALPALQRSQRDDARKKDVTIVASAVQSWQGNNRSGGWPTSAQVQSYATNVSGNTQTTPTNLITVAATVTGPLTATPADGAVVVYPQGVCGAVNNASGVAISKGTNRQYAVVARLESGNNSAFCLDS